MIRRLTRRNPPSGKNGEQVKELLSRELLWRLTQEAGEKPSEKHMTNARLLVCSIVDRSIAKGDFRGLKYLTDLVGIGERADMKREQLFLEKKRCDQKQPRQNQAGGKETDMSRAAAVYRSVQNALMSHLPSRSLEDIMGSPPANEK